MKRKICLLGIIILLVFLAVPGFAQDNQINNSYIPVDRVLSGNTTDAAAPVGYLVDDNKETGWGFQSGSTQGWAELKLKQEYLIHGLKVSGLLGEDAELIVEYKEDNRWKPFLASLVTDLSADKFVDLSFDRVAAKELRLRLYGKGVQSSKLSEVKVLGEKPNEIYHQIKPKEVTASGDTAPTYPAKFLIDENTYTMWKVDPYFSYGRGNTDQLERFFNQESSSQGAKGKGKKKHKGNQESSGEVVFNLKQSYKINSIHLYFTEQAQGDFRLEAKQEGSWKELKYIAQSSYTKGWKRVDLSDQKVTADEVRIKVTGYSGAVGGISEVKFWGRKFYSGDKHKLIGPQGPEKLTNKLHRQFVLNEEEVKDYYLELAVKEKTDKPIEVELNGKKITLQPDFNLRGHTVYRKLLKRRKFWSGTNFVELSSSTSLTLINAQLSEDKTKSSQSYSLKGLNNNLLLTESELKSNQEFSLKQKTLIEKVKIYSKAEDPYFRVYAWVDNQWKELTNQKVASGSVRFKGVVTTDKLKVENPGGFPVSEISVLGSGATDSAPAVKILKPKDEEIVGLKANGKQKLIGFVDNPEAEVTVNGADATQNGHYFWLRLKATGLRPWEAEEITAEAEDKQGRESSHQITALLGKTPALTVDQEDKLVYTDKEKFVISGRVEHHFNKVLVNGEPVELSGEQFSTEVKLEEGLNLIKIESILKDQKRKKKFKTTAYRKVVHYSKPLKATINSPSPNYYTGKKEIIVAGVVENSLGKPTVQVNGKKAAVEGMFFTSKPVPLTEGKNSIEVIVSDNKEQVKEEITVYRDTIPPSIEDVWPEDGYLSNEATLEVTGKAVDRSPVSVYVNGEISSQTEDKFTKPTTFPDGEHLITIRAVDRAGNESYHKLQVTVDTTPPQPFEVTADPADWTNNTQPIINFNTTDATSGVDHYEYAVNDGEFKQVKSPYQLPSQPDGEHTVKVKAVDKAGWERLSTTKIYIDTTPPDKPETFRAVPGNGKITLKWGTPNPDVIEYKIKRTPSWKANKPYKVVTGNQFTDSNLENGKQYSYQIWAVDRAYNEGKKTEPYKATVGLTVTEYKSDKGAVVEYDNLSLFVSPESLPKEAKQIRITEVESKHLKKKSSFPIISPIYRVSASVKGEQSQKEIEHIAFEKKFIGRLKYDESKIPGNFPEQNLGVYYFSSTWGRWFKVKDSRVDVKNNTIYFSTNHFTPFSVQPVMVEDLSPQELQNVDFSPLSSNIKHEGVEVAPQSGSAMTEVTELSLPGRNEFDFNLKRRYDSATARGDAPGLAVNAKLGISIGDFLSDGINIEKKAEEILRSSKISLGSQYESMIKKYYQNNGDYSYSMGLGWRLNLPYIRGSNSKVLVRTPDGSFHSINKMDVIENKNYGIYRQLVLQNHESEDFTLKLTQIRLDINCTKIVSSGKMTIPGWQLMRAKLIMKNGKTYKMDALGRTTKIIGSNSNSIKLHYKGPEVELDLLGIADLREEIKELSEVDFKVPPFEIKFPLHLDYIEDSVGREIHFAYDKDYIVPRIKKIWVKNDGNHNRDINYKFAEIGDVCKSPLPLLSKAEGIGDREWEYEYDFNFLFSGEMGVKVNVLSVVGDIIAGCLGAPGAFSTATGIDNVTLKSGVQCEWVFPLKEVKGPGIGCTKINYAQKLLAYDVVEAKDYFLGIEALPTAVEYSFNVLEKFLVSKVKTYKDKEKSPIKETTYDYNLSYYGHEQFYNKKTIVNDGKTIKKYYYNAMDKRRNRFIDVLDWGVELINNVISSNGQLNGLLMNKRHYRCVIPYNTKVKIYDAEKKKLLRTYKKEYHFETMRITKRVILRDKNKRIIRYRYDNWGNVVYKHDTGKDLVVKKHYLNTSSKKDKEEFEPSPFENQEEVDNNIHNLMAAKIVYNENPRDGEIKQESAYKYDKNGNLLVKARYHKDFNSENDKWLKTIYKYNNEYGNVNEIIYPEGNYVTKEYSDKYRHAFPTVIKKYNKKEELLATVKYGYDFMLGKKKWKIDPLGNLTEYKYDNLNRLIKTVYPEDGEAPDKKIANSKPADYENRNDNPVKIQHYDDENYITTIVNATENISVDDYRVKNDEISGPIFNKSKYYYDRLGRWIKLNKYLKEDGSARTLTTKFEYDSWGNRVKTVDDEGKITRKEYDALGRVTKIEYPHGSNMTFEYNENEMSKTMIDPEGNKVVEYKDWSGNVTKVVRFNNGYKYVRRAMYDSFGNRIRRVDEEGRATDFYYNDLNKLVQKKLPQDEYMKDGQSTLMRPTIIYEYDKNGRRVSRTDARGNKIKFKYDGLNRKTKKIVHMGNSPDTITKSDRITKYEYNARGDKTGVAKLAGGEVVLEKKFAYDSRGNKIAEIDGKGNVTYFEYNIIGKEIAKYDPRGVIKVSSNGEITINGQHYELAPKYKTEYNYDTLGRKVRVIYPKAEDENGNLTKLTYDKIIKYNDIGKKKEVIKGDRRIKYNYNDMYWVTEKKVITSSKTKTTSYTYDNVGNKLTVIDPEGNTTEYQYNSLYQKVKVINPDGNSKEFRYDKVGNKIREKDERGNVKEYKYNTQNKLVEVCEPEVKDYTDRERDNPITEYRYDPNGNLIKKIMSNDLVTEYKYNNANQKIEEIKPGGQTTTYSYNAAGKLETKINARGIKEKYVYYKNGKVDKVKYFESTEVEEADEEINYQYDKAGNRTLVSKLDSSISQSYDSLSRITKEVRSISGKTYNTNYKYDMYGNLAGIKYPGSSEYLTYNYNKLGELKWIEGIAGSESSPAFQYNKNSQVTNLTYDNGVKTEYSYNEMSRPISIVTTKTNDKGETEELLDLNYEYDSVGNVTNRNGNRYRYEYDNLNRLTSADIEGSFYLSNTGNKGKVIEDYLGEKGVDVLVEDIENITLDYAAGSVGVAFAEKVENITRLELDSIGEANHRLTKRTLDIYYSDDNSNYTKLAKDNWEYERDYKGNITIMIPEGISAKYVKVHSKFNDRNAEFDPIKENSEFKNVLKDSIKVYRREEEATLVYKYDSVGNRTQKKLIASTVETTDYTYDDETNQLITNGKFAYKYDDAGNMIAKGNKYKIEDGEVTFTKTEGEKVKYWRYKYNLQNRLSEVYKNGKLIAEFTYDADGNRIKTIEYTHEDKKEVNYVYDQNGQVLVEKNITKEKFTSFVYAAGKKYAKVKGIIDDYLDDSVEVGLVYYHHNNLGSTRVMTNQDGEKVFDQDYLPFGGDLPKPGQLEVQNETDESYKYTGQKEVASIGLYYYGARYYDPAIGRFTRQDSYRGELDNPQTQHLYVYVTNNPLKYIDPTGHRLVKGSDYEEESESQSSDEKPENDSSAADSSKTNNQNGKEGQLLESVFTEEVSNEQGENNLLPTNNMNYQLVEQSKQVENQKEYSIWDNVVYRGLGGLQFAGGLGQIGLGSTIVGSSGIAEFVSGGGASPLAIPFGIFGGYVVGHGGSNTAEGFRKFRYGPSSEGNWNLVKKGYDKLGWTKGYYVVDFGLNAASIAKSSGVLKKIINGEKVSLGTVKSTSSAFDEIGIYTRSHLNPLISPGGAGLANDVIGMGLNIDSIDDLEEQQNKK